MLPVPRMPQRIESVMSSPFSSLDTLGIRAESRVFRAAGLASDPWAAGGERQAVIRKKEDRVLTGRQTWELRSCELVFASVEVLHSVAAGPPTQQCAGERTRCSPQEASSVRRRVTTGNRNAAPFLQI